MSETTERSAYDKLSPQRKQLADPDFKDIQIRPADKKIPAAGNDPAFQEGSGIYHLMVTSPFLPEKHRPDPMNRHIGGNDLHMLKPEGTEMIRRKAGRVKRIQSHSGKLSVKGCVHFQSDTGQLLWKKTQIISVVAAEKHQRVMVLVQGEVKVAFQPSVGMEVQMKLPAVFRGHALKPEHRIGTVGRTEILFKKNDGNITGLLVLFHPRLDICAGTVPEFQNASFAEFLKTSARGAQGQMELAGQFAQRGKPFPLGKISACDHGFNVTRQFGGPQFIV